MAITRDQKSLLRAVIQQKTALVEEKLEEGISPVFPNQSATTPLHEAVKNDNFYLVKILIEAGARVDCATADGTLPIDLAENMTMIRYLKDKAFEQETDFDDDAVMSGPRRKKKAPAKKKNGRARRKAAAKSAPTSVRQSMQEQQEPEKPAFTAKTLPDIFKPENWVGKVDEMRKLWTQVPKQLKKEFNFSAALTKVRQQTLRGKISKAPVLHKPGKTKTPPDPQI